VRLQLALTLVLAGCSSAPTAPAATAPAVAPPAAPAVAPPAAPAVALKPESEIVVAGGGGVIAQAAKAILGPWAAKNGVKLTYLEANSTASLARIQAGAQAGLREIDVVLNNEQSIALGRPNNLWEPLNPQLIPNLQNLDQSIAFPRDFLGDPPVGVRAFVLPVGLAYNTEIFKKNGWEAPTSWEDLYNPKYGKCVLPLSPKSGLPYLQLLSFINTGSYTNNTVTLDRFRAITTSVPTFTDSNPAALELLQQGTGCLAPSQQHRTLEQQSKGAPIDFVNPKEGTPFVGATIAVIRNAPHPIAAQLAVDELLSETAAANWQEIAYLITTNVKATRSKSGVAAKLPVASEFQSLGFRDTPRSAFDNLDTLIRQWDAMAAGG
jgi:putative spermidine/putrescine transport system substrate-binding protein